MRALTARSNDGQPLPRSQPSGKKGRAASVCGQPSGSSLMMNVVSSRCAYHTPIVSMALPNDLRSASVRWPSASFCISEPQS